MKTLGKFGPDFLDRAPDLEKELIRHGLDPEDFIIEKTSNIPQGCWSYLYTVTVKDQSFTVSMPNDIEFLKYFYGICFPPEEQTQAHPKEHKLIAVIQRMEKWLAEDSSKKMIK